MKNIILKDLFSKNINQGSKNLKKVKVVLKEKKMIIIFSNP